MHPPTQAECVQHGLQTIAFCKTRKLCELVTAYTRETLRCTAPDLAARVAVYRAGYSPSERRSLERALHDGTLCAVAATNALELGVDVGDLDVTLHLGFPGSIASLKQQAGRAGRRGQASMSVLIGFDGPLDQYFMRHPAALFGRPLEHTVIDTLNQRCLQAHLLCAAAELPLMGGREAAVFGAGVWEAAAQLQGLGLLGRHPKSTGDALALHYTGATASPASGAVGCGTCVLLCGRITNWSGCDYVLLCRYLFCYVYVLLCTAMYCYVLLCSDNVLLCCHCSCITHALLSVSCVFLFLRLSARTPAGISLRAIDPDRFSIVDETTGNVVEEIEDSKAFWEVYDGAVYLFQVRAVL